MKPRGFGGATLAAVILGTPIHPSRRRQATPWTATTQAICALRVSDCCCTSYKQPKPYTGNEVPHLDTIVVSAVREPMTQHQPHLHAWKSTGTDGFPCTIILQSALLRHAIHDAETCRLPSWKPRSGASPATPSQPDRHSAEAHARAEIDERKNQSSNGQENQTVRAAPKTAFFLPHRFLQYTLSKRVAREER